MVYEYFSLGPHRRKAMCVYDKSRRSIITVNCCSAVASRILYAGGTPH